MFKKTQLFEECAKISYCYKKRQKDLSPSVCTQHDDISITGKAISTFALRTQGSRSCAELFFCFVYKLFQTKILKEVRTFVFQITQLLNLREEECISRHFHILCYRSSSQNYCYNTLQLSGFYTWFCNFCFSLPEKTPC